DRVGLERLAGFRAPGVPLARREDRGDELGLDVLEIGPIVEALDDYAQGPGGVALHLLAQFLLGPDRLEDPDMLFGERRQAVYRHLQGHLVAAALGKIYDDVVSLDARDSPDVPCAM